MNSFPHKTHRALLITTTFLLSTLAWAARAELKVGDPLPDLSLFQLEGQLPDTLKGKVVLIDFWASWCGPCAKSFPVMDQLQQRYKDRGLVILAISADTKKADLDKFLKKNQVSFTIVRDAAQKLVAEADVKAMPTSILVGRDSKIRFIHNGFHGETGKQYTTEIETLLKETP